MNRKTLLFCAAHNCVGKFMFTIVADDTLYNYGVLNIKYNATLFYSKCLFPLATHIFPAGNIFDDDMAGILGLKLRAYVSKFSTFCDISARFKPFGIFSVHV